MIHRWEIAADLRPFPFPCRGIFACIPIDKSAHLKKKRDSTLKVHATVLYCSKYCGKGHFRRFSSKPSISAVKLVLIMLLDLWQLRFTICPRPLLLWAYRRYHEIVNIRILYTDIYSRYKNSPVSRVASSRGKSHDGKMKPILSR